MIERDIDNREIPMTSSSISRRTFSRLAAASWVAAAAPAIAATPKSLRIGSVILTTAVGPVQPGGALKGSQALISRVNREGGIKGARIELIAENDHFNPAEHRDKVKAMAADPSLLAFLHPMGTRQVAATMEAVRDIAVVGPISGAPELRGNTASNLFWTRVTFSHEIDRLLQTAKTMAIHSVGLVYPDEPLGQSLLAAFRAGCEKHKITPAAAATTPSTISVEVDPAAKAMAAANPQLVIMGVNNTPLLVKALRRHGFGGSIFGLSLGAGADNLRALGEHARGLGFALHVPSPTAQKYELIRNYQADMQAAGVKEFDLFSVEAYISASVLVHALRRVSGDYSRQSVMQALEGISNLDLGGLRVRFGKGVREGTDFVSVATVSPDGRLIM